MGIKAKVLRIAIKYLNVTWKDEYCISLHSNVGIDEGEKVKLWFRRKAVPLYYVCNVTVYDATKIVSAQILL